MKTLILIRHAKSKDKDLGGADFTRRLAERGEADACLMGERIKKRKIKIDAFVSSSATRAKNTCKLFASTFSNESLPVSYREDLYMADEETFMKVIKELDNRFDSIALFSHNPGITYFANRLCPEVRIDNMPTSGIFAVAAAVDDWSNFDSVPKTFLFFDAPKLG